MGSQEWNRPCSATAKRAIAGNSAVVGLVILLTLLVMAPPYAAATETRPIEPFSPLIEPETEDSVLDPITDPNGIAVDEVSGNVFVNDAGTHTEILGATGGPPVNLVSPYQLTSGCSFGIAANGNVVAVDNSASSAAKGTVYVACTNGKIRPITRNSSTEKYEAGAEITYPGAAANATGTVDGSGNLWVSSFNPPAVYKFSPLGTLSETIVLPTTARPSSIAVDEAGNLFYRVAAQGRVLRCPVDGLGVIAAGSCAEALNIAGLTGIAIDRGAGKLYLALGSRAAQYSVALSLAEDFQFGEGVLETTRGIAVNPVTDRVYVSDTGAAKDNIAAFGPAVPLPTVTTKAAQAINGVSATLTGTVDPEGADITACTFEYGKTEAYGLTAPCDGAIPTDSTEHPVAANIAGLEPNGVVYHYRLVVDSSIGGSKGLDRTLVTGKTVFTEPASDIAATTVALNGSVMPEGSKLADCKFEFGRTASYGSSAPCNPAAGVIPDDFASHAVAAELTGLEENTEYHFRLTATTASGSVNGDDLSFTTLGRPQIVEQVPIDVEQTSVGLQARINPSGSATTYYFEWGPEGSGSLKRVPADHELFVGSGGLPVRVAAAIAGLQPATDYIFRVVATNVRGTTVGADQPFETLNQRNFPNGRAAELVSPPDKRPVGIVEQLVHSQVYFQPAESGEGVGYMVFNGVDGTPSGGEVIYAGSRSSEGWRSKPVTPPALIPSPDASGDIPDASPGMVRYLDPADLRCGVVETHNPVSADTPVADIEQGVFNLYRWNAVDGTYTLLTNRIPINPAAGGTGNYEVIGASEDCSRIFFRSSTYRFIVGASGIYEWDDGTLRDAALRPDGTPPTLTSGEGGAAQQLARAKQSVAVDGRFFFTAPDAANEGKPAVFVRKGVSNVDQASDPEPGHGPIMGARFEGASTNGERAFFLANYGLTDDPSNGPNDGICTGNGIAMHNTACDLYAYDVESGELTNVSASSNPGDANGAVAQGVMATSEDGSVVYFAARGQLVPGEGRTYAQNLQGEGHASVYRYDFDAAPGGRLAYVGSLTKEDVGKQAMMHAGNGWSSQTNDEGTYFLYASRDDLGQLNPNGVEMAYVYSAKSRMSECLSCPRDGDIPHNRPQGEPGFPSVIPAPSEQAVGKGAVTIDALSADGRAIFDSEDVLAPGAVEGQGKVMGTALSRFPAQSNIYEWYRGQISLLATGAVLAIGVGGPDGRDVFIRSFERLSAHDVDFSADLYDLRSGGGFAPPVAPPDKCVVEAEQCQGAISPPPSPSAPATNVARSGNKVFPNPSRPRCRKSKIRKNGKCVQRRSAKKKSRSQGGDRPASTNRGGAK